MAEVYVGIDVGGHHITISIANTANLAVEKTFQFETKSYASLAEPLEEVTTYLNNRTVKACCTGGAGPLLSIEQISLTNANFLVNKKEIQKALNTESVTLVNDFMLIGYALLANEEVFQKLTPNKQPRVGAKVIIGVGTGLGKCSIVYPDGCKPLVIPSEGGHRDFSPKTDEDRNIIQFIKEKTGHYAVSYEDILSGQGISLLHEYFEGNKVVASKVFLSSQKTLDYFSSVLGQFAKNSTLDSLAIGGVYFAGGILIKHPEVFEQEAFHRAFTGSKRHLDLLTLIPQYLLHDYKTSAFGACYAASLLK